MIDKKLIQDTINELLDANIDKKTIYSTLKDIGVDEGDIEKNYLEIINEKKEIKEKPSKDTSENSEEKKEPKKEETVKEEPKKEKLNYSKIEEPEKKEEKADIINDFNINEKDQNEDDLIKTSAQVNEINENQEQEKYPNLKTKQNIETKNTINSDVQEELTEIKAQLKALTKIMKDVLEENRNILNKL